MVIWEGVRTVRERKENNTNKKNLEKFQKKLEVKTKEDKDIVAMARYIRDFQVTDLLAFGNILGVEEKDPFEDYVSEILLSFSQRERKQRKQFLKLAKDVVQANKELATEAQSNGD